MEQPKIVKDNNCFYLVLDLKGLSLYERSKAISKFVRRDTKILEECIETEIKAQLDQLGINAYAKSESVLIKALDTLNAMGKRLVINDLYSKPLDDCDFVAKSDNYMNVVIESHRYLQCGKEIKII